MILQNRLPERIVLQQRIYLFSRAQRWVLWALGLPLAVLFFLAIALKLYALSNYSWDPALLLNTLQMKLVRDPGNTAVNLFFLLAVVLQLSYLRLAQRHERLILTATGIEYRSPLPRWLHALRPDWALAWGEIRNTTIQGMLRARDARQLALELDSARRKVRIYPYRWVDPATFQPPSPWSELKKLRKAKTEEMLDAIEQSAVVQYLAAVAPRLMPSRQVLPGVIGFAIESQPRALAVVVVFFALFLYALGDTFIFGHEIYADLPPYGIFAAAAVVAAAAVWLWLRRSGIPRAECLGIAMLFGGALGGALYPAALRVNALTDVNGLRYYDYQLTAQLTLTPLSSGLPSLAFPRYADYWSTQKTGSVHYFELRRGGLGFYQLNMLPVEKTLRDFYEQQQRNRQPDNRLRELRKI